MNVFFSKRTEDFLKDLQSKAANDNVRKYIKSNLRRWLITCFEDVKAVKIAKSTDPAWLKDALERGDKVYSLDLGREDMETISHWIDYLNIVEGNISRISIPQLKKKVKEWEESFKKQKANEEDGIELVHGYSDGFSWVRVFGKNSLNREGNLMNHCVGSYYNQVKDGKITIYSLRDRNNKPHCTIELTNREIEQIKGNSNSPVKEEYTKYVLDFLEKKYVNFKTVNDEELLNIGLVKIGGKTYFLNNLPKNLYVYGDLDLSYTSIISLPESLSVGGNLNLSYTEITSLPEDLTVDGDLDLNYTNITSLPESLSVGRNLNLSYTNITSLPEGLNAGRDLDLSYTEITSLPEGLNVGRDLDLSYSSITNLPEGLSVGRNLNLRGTKITSLPESLSVGGNLDLSYTDITSLPESLRVGGNLYLNHTEIANLPEGLRVDDNLNLSYTEITNLPEGLRVSGNLDLRGTDITSLPEGLHVKGNLNLRGTKITSLPESLSVGGNLDLRGTKITSLPENLSVGGEIYK